MTLDCTRPSPHHPPLFRRPPPPLHNQPPPLHQPAHPATRLPRRWPPPPIPTNTTTVRRATPPPRRPICDVIVVVRAQHNRHLQGPIYLPLLEQRQTKENNCRSHRHLQGLIYHPSKEHRQPNENSHNRQSQQQRSGQPAKERNISKRN